MPKITHQNLANSLKLSLAVILVCIALVIPVVSIANSKGTPNTLLWEVSGNGLKAPSYIFGTIHALCPENFSISKAVKKRLELSDQLSLELDMDAPNFMAELIQCATLPAGSSLSSMFTAAEYSLLEKHLANSMQLDLKMFENMKPFMLQSLLLSQLTECKAISYEQRLMEMAHAQGKEVVGVETIKEQLAAMDKLPLQLQTSILVNTAKDLTKARASYQEMVKLYLAQDLDGLMKITHKDLTPKEHKLYEDIFIIDRNKRWLPAIEREASAKPTFFAFGAAHLSGQNGLLELLRQKGYTVKPVID